MHRLKFDNQLSAIEFFMLVRQFRRITKKIEKIHDSKLSKDTIPEEVDNALAYYLNEKHLLLYEIKAVLEHTSETPEIKPAKGAFPIKENSNDKKVDI